MSRERKNNDFPLWRKRTPGTLILRRKERIKEKQKIQCAVEDLGRFALDFDLLDSGKGKFKVTKKIIKAAVKKAEKAMIRKGVDNKPIRKVTKLKDLPSSKKEITDLSFKVPGDETYKVKHSGGGKYNVVSSSDKKMNDSPLTKDAAKELKKQLEK